MEILAIPQARVTLGQSLTLICNITTGSSYVWTFVNTGTTLAETTNALSLAIVTVSDLGTYRCDATNATNSTGSDAITIEEGG